MLTRNRLAAWMLLMIIGVVDWIWSRHAGLTFVGWPAFALWFGPVAFVGIFYEVSGRDQRLANLGDQIALWLAFSAVGIIFTYDAASLRLPLRDADFAAIDAALGFHWPQWSKLIGSHRLVARPLTVAYFVLVPEIFLTVIYFAHIGRGDRNDEFLWMIMVSLVICTVLSAFFPAVGPCTYFFGVKPRFIQHLLAVRAGTVKTFSLNAMEGIITWPSFHAVFAVVTPYVHRPPIRTFVPITAVNILMLISIPTNGCHYLFDVLAGLVLAFTSILMVRGAFRIGWLRA
ncbi:MAG TPA: phosphatase PAP2 family protein [Candidatus Binataceae bacterium]|nr:phosphatase PAP2 family protein [Candidatus Binataceae bacterium]